jgi:hypothetical protein
MSIYYKMSEYIDATSISSDDVSISSDITIECDKTTERIYELRKNIRNGLRGTERRGPICTGSIPRHTQEQSVSCFLCKKTVNLILCVACGNKICSGCNENSVCTLCVAMGKYNIPTKWKRKRRWFGLCCF